MKIGLLVPEMPPDTIGGGGAVFEALATQLFYRGHDVVVVTSHTYGAARHVDRYPFPTVRLREFPHPSSAYRTYMPPYPHELLRVRKLFASCDVVNAHGHGHPLVDLLTRLWVSPKKTVYTLHGFLYSVPKRGGALARIYRVYDRLFGVQALERSRSVTAVSSAVATEAAKRGRPDTLVINNGFAPFGEPASLPQHILHEMERGPYVLGVGRLEHLKGFDILVRAVATVRSAGIPLRVLLAGRDNGAQAAIEDLARTLGIRDALSLVGFVAHAALPKLFNGAFAYVLSSRTEAFPAAPLESMSMETPCILANVGGVADIARDAHDALLYPPERADLLAERILEMWRDDALRQRLAKNGLETSARFAWPAVAEKYERVFSTLAGTSR